MTTEKEVEPNYLYQLWCEKNEDFFKRIDKFGGWPIGKKFVSFFHSGPAGPRRCEFGDVYMRNEWWTTICSADDYYKWKLSPEALQEIRDEGRKEAIRKLGGVAV